MKPKTTLRTFLLVASSALMANVNTARAAEYWWNQNGVSNGWGAIGTWNTTNAFFSTTNSDTASAAAASTQIADTLNFGTSTVGFAGGLITVGGTQNIGTINIGSANATGTSFITGTLNFAASGTLTNNASGESFVTTITGAATRLDLNATGGGITLFGANTHSGITYVNTGTVTANENGVFGTGGTDASRTVVASGARISFNNSPRTYTERFEIAGAGVGGSTGALANSQTTTNLNGLVSLSDAATIYSGAGTLTLGGGISLGSNALTFNVAGGTQTIQTTGISGTDGSVVKSGGGVLNLNIGSSYTGATSINGGTLKLGANNVLPHSITSTVAIGAATLDADTRTDLAGTLDVTGDATINLGAGAALAFADSSDVDWNDIPGTLNITGTLGATSLQFGTDETGLSPAQLAKISVNGNGLGTYTLDGSGYLIAGGGAAPEIDVHQGGDIANGGSKGFGTVTLGSTTSLEFTINNTGSAALNLLGTPPDYVAVGGANAGEFTVTAQPGTPVASDGGSTTFTVQFAPTAVGVRNAVLTIANNDSSESTFTINVSGTGQTKYEEWAGAAAFNDDANGDGVDNGLAFLLGVPNANDNALSFLPDVTEDNGNLVLTFSCLNATARGGSVLNVQYSNDMGVADFWADHTAAVPGEPTVTTVNSVNFKVSTGAGNLVDVIATIPVTEAADGKLFGRVTGQP